MRQRIGQTGLGRRGEYHVPFGYKVMGSVLEVKFEGESSECQAVSQKQTEVMEQELLFLH